MKIVRRSGYDEVLGVHIIGLALDRARRRSDAGAPARIHGRRARAHHPRASDDVRSHRGGRSCDDGNGDTSMIGDSRFSIQISVASRTSERENAELPMSTEVVMPQMGESIAEGTIVRWIKKVGDTIDKDEPLFEISTDKVDAEIPSPGAGVLLAIQVKEGETVPVNSVVAVIGAAGETVPAGRSLGVTRKPRHRPTGRRADNGGEPGAARRPRRIAAAPTAPARRSADLQANAFVTPRPPIAEDHGIDISRLRERGISGRVTRQDIKAFIAAADRRGAHRPRHGRAPATPFAFRPSNRATTSASRRCASCGGRSPSTWSIERSDVAACLLGLRSRLRPRRQTPSGEEGRVRSRGRRS